MNIVCGPAGLRTNSGCPPIIAQTMPTNAWQSKNSIAPSLPPVFSYVNPPNAIAGPKQPKYMYKVAVTVFTVSNPSVQSLAYTNERLFTSSIMPPQNLPLRSASYALLFVALVSFAFFFLSSMQVKNEFLWDNLKTSMASSHASRTLCFALNRRTLSSVLSPCMTAERTSKACGNLECFFACEWSLLKSLASETKSVSLAKLLNAAFMHAILFQQSRPNSALLSSSSSSLLLLLPCKDND